MKFNRMKFNRMKFNKELTKIVKKNTNDTTVIVIILIVLLIGLGIYWYYKHTTILEGIIDSPPAASPPENTLGRLTNSLNSFMADLKAETGQSGTSFDATSTADIVGLMDKLKKVTGLTQQTDSIYDAERPYAIPADDDPANLINRMSTSYPGETFLTEGRNRFSDSFCETYGPGSGSDLNVECNKLTAENCNQTKCCIFLNGQKCVAGNQAGPSVTVDASTGEDIDYTYYSYKNTCYGSCDNETSTTSANPCSSYTNDSTSIDKSCINRYWKQTVCGEAENNPNYITDNLVKEWKNHSRAAIKEKIQDIASDERHYAKCYGTDETKWPLPCDGTTVTSFGLSQRCMTDLFKKTGCTYDGTVNQAFVEEHKLEPKSAMINIFTGYFNGKDTVSKQKCYGPDEMAWPDGCANVSDGTLLSNVPKECVESLWRKIYKGVCRTDFLDNLYDSEGKLIEITPLLAGTVADLKNTSADQIEDMLHNPTKRTQCYGSNPNNWPGITKVTPDPCAGIPKIFKRNAAGQLVKTATSEVSVGCRQRLADLVSSTNLTDATDVANMKVNLRTGNPPTGELDTVLSMIRR